MGEFSQINLISEAHQQKEELLLSAEIAANSEDDTTMTSGKKVAKNKGRFNFKDVPIFTLTNAMSALTYAIYNLLGDQTDLISGEMATTADLLAPFTQKWSQYFQDVLQHDNDQVKGKSGSALSQAVGQFNLDNTKNTGFQTGSGAISSLLSQKTSSFETNFGNLQTLAQKAVTDLESSIIQDWVI